MKNLLKMETYHLFTSRICRYSIIGILIMGFFTAETYVEEILGTNGKAAASLTDIFNGMVYDSTFLLIITSSILSLVLGQEFSSRTITQEISAGHSRKNIFASKVLSYLLAFNCMTVLYPLAGCVREYARFGIADSGAFFYNVGRGIFYSFLENSAVFLIAIFLCCRFKNAAKATAATAIITFVLSLYLGYSPILKLPVSFLPTFQIREAVRNSSILNLPALIVSFVWVLALLFLSWKSFSKTDLK